MNKRTTLLSCIILILYAQSIVSMNTKTKTITFEWTIDICLMDGPEKIKIQEEYFLQFLAERRNNIKKQNPSFKDIATILSLERSHQYTGQISFEKKLKHKKLKQKRRVRFSGLSLERSDDDIDGAINAYDVNKSIDIPIE